MASLSALAETIIDLARSEAKRSSNEKVGHLHLLAAVRRWQEEQFDTKFPGLSSRLKTALSATAGNALKVDGFEDNVFEQIEQVRNSEDLWQLANTLSEKVPSDAPNTDQLHNPSPNTEGVDTSIKSSVNDPLPFSITPGLIERVATALSQSTESVQADMLGAAYAVAVHLLGSPLPDLSAKICTAADLPIADFSHITEIPQLVSTIATSDIQEAGRLATQVAIALVETAEWAAAIDQDVTQEETDKIDEVRLILRAQLGDKINVTTDAMTRFEEKFSHLVGMETVKTEIRKRVDFLVINKRRAVRGMRTENHRMHSAFVGNPGTGKTTVARLYGELLNELGLLPTNKFVETDRAGLIGKYIGETEDKTTQVVESAVGGVLFIDEAYALNDNYGERKGFGEEATDCLVKHMEDKRDSLVVILAGYRLQTLEYIGINPGLKSRVPAVIDFPDYTVDELVQIAESIVARRSLTLDHSAIELIRTAMTSELKKTGFGNARSVENLLEAAERNAVNRTSQLGPLATEKELRTIVSADIPSPEELSTSDVNKKTIGFR
jgi:stage V sporulation protein K